jgi:restriction endonuclease S subunit
LAKAEKNLEQIYHLMVEKLRQLSKGDAFVKTMDENKSFSYIGKEDSCFFEKMAQTVFESKNIRIRVWTEFVEPNFVSYFLQTRHARDQIELECKQTVGMATVSQEDIIKWLIPFAPYFEQKRLVSKIDELFSYANQVEKTVELTNKNVESAEQAILFKAFRGELVSQNPNDESASVLLEKIRAQRSTVRKEKRFL